MTLDSRLPSNGDSGSSQSRWDETRQMTASIAPKVAQYAGHGIDLHFLNRPNFYSSLRTGEEVSRAFKAVTPAHGTPTGVRVNDILDGYMCTQRYYRDLAPLNLLIFTDGEANDEETLNWTVIEHLTELAHHGYPAYQLGIEFVQIGNCINATHQLVHLEARVNRRFKYDYVGITSTTHINYANPDLLLADVVRRIIARIHSYVRPPRTSRRWVS